MRRSADDVAWRRWRFSPFRHHRRRYHHHRPTIIAAAILPLLALRLFFFFFPPLLLPPRALAPETSALFMGSRLQLHWRILHEGCTKSTAVASFGSSVYPSPLPPSSLPPSLPPSLSAVPAPSRTFPPMRGSSCACAVLSYSFARRLSLSSYSRVVRRTCIIHTGVARTKRRALAARYFRATWFLVRALKCCRRLTAG